MPEIPVLGFISFCQTNNFLLIINIIMIVIKPNINYKINNVYFISQIIFYILNYRYYQTKKIGLEILNQPKYKKK